MCDCYWGGGRSKLYTFRLSPFPRMLARGKCLRLEPLESGKIPCNFCHPGGDRGVPSWKGGITQVLICYNPKGPSKPLGET